LTFFSALLSSPQVGQKAVRGREKHGLLEEETQ
jgi:hypothetical protein